MEKKELRNKIKELKNIHKEELEERSKQVIKQLKRLDLFQNAKCIALYHALPDEVRTIELIEEFAEKKVILLPVVIGDDLEFRPYRGTQYTKKGPFGILEPDPTPEGFQIPPIDLFIIPGVAFDAQLNRLGRGRGFYDRMLKMCDAPKVGLCFNFQLVENVPTEEFDQPMDAVITEDQILGIR